MKSLSTYAPHAGADTLHWLQIITTPARGPFMVVLRSVRSNTEKMPGWFRRNDQSGTELTSN